MNVQTYLLLAFYALATPVVVGVVVFRIAVAWVFVREIGRGWG